MISTPLSIINVAPYSSQYEVSVSYFYPNLLDCRECEVKVSRRHVPISDTDAIVRNFPYSTRRRLQRYVLCEEPPPCIRFFPVRMLCRTLPTRYPIAVICGYGPNSAYRFGCNPPDAQVYYSAPLVPPPMPTSCHVYVFRDLCCRCCFL